MMKYKDYSAKVEYDADAEILHGSVLDILDVVTFQATSVEELKVEFARSVETYLQLCKDHGEAPEKPFSGRFQVRISPELHRAVVLSAKRDGKSMNAWVENVLSGSVYQSCSHQSRDHADIGAMPVVTRVKTVRLETSLSLPSETTVRNARGHKNRIASVIDEERFTLYGVEEDAS